MSDIILLTLLFVLPFIMIFIFSFTIILSAMNKKNIKLNLFAFRFNLGDKIKARLERPKAAQSTIILDPTVENEPDDTDNAMEEPPEAVVPKDIPDEQDNIPEEPAEEIKDSEDYDDFEEFEEYDDFRLTEDDAGTKKNGKATMLMGGIKDRFAQAQTDAQARAIEKEEKRLQEDLELYDADETPEEMPDDFRGKLGYWWRNNFGFRVITCGIVVFLIFGMGFYGFLAKNSNISQDAITADADVAEGSDGNDVTIEEDFNLISDGDLTPSDVAPGSMDEDPNLAEIIATAQQSVGSTPTSYTGSNTTTQPSGAIGTISIPSINLTNAPVMSSTELSDLAKGTGHFDNTPLLDGNVGIAGHNNTYFKYLVNVDIGDTVKYTVNGVTRTYQVTDIRAISDTDWGVFTDYGDNRLTLVTCEHLVPNSRIAVTAIQVGSDTTTSTNTAAVYTGKSNSSIHQDSGDYHDAGSGYTDYIGVFTGNN